MYMILTAENADDLAYKVETYLAAVSHRRLLGPPQANFSGPGDCAIWWQAIIGADVLT